MTRVRLVCCCVLLAGCALKAPAVATPSEPPILILPLTIPGDVRICIQETPQRMPCLTVDELRQVIATLKRL